MAYYEEARGPQPTTRELAGRIAEIMFEMATATDPECIEFLREAHEHAVSDYEFLRSRGL